MRDGYLAAIVGGPVSMSRLDWLLRHLTAVGYRIAQCFPDRNDDHSLVSVRALTRASVLSHFRDLIIHPGSEGR